MTRQNMLLCTAVASLFLAGVFALAADQGERIVPGEQQRLSDRVTELETRVAVLEQQRRLMNTSALPVRAPAASIPPGWQRRSFNGGFYDIVPLASEPTNGHHPNEHSTSLQGRTLSLVRSGGDSATAAASAMGSR